MKKQGVYLQAMAADAKEAVIDVVGVIGWDVWFPAMRDMLRSIPQTVERVVFDIYSPGGSVWDGNGIVQEIGKLTQHTVARVQVAASMATLIAVACKERTIASNGRFLVHNAWTVTEGDADAHEKRAKELRDCEDEAVKFYSARTGKTEESIRALMSEERWMTPAEAKEWGFVTAIDDPFDVSAFAGVRDEITAAGQWPVALVDVVEEPKDDAATDRTEGDAVPQDGTPDKPAVPDNQGPTEEAIKAARDAGYALGVEAANDALTARADAAEKQVECLLKSKADLTQKLDAQIAEARKLQGERDQARATIEKQKAAIDEANSKLARLLAGGLTFSPSVETWADALKACNNDYEKARKQFPEVYRAQREQDKANRK